VLLGSVSSEVVEELLFGGDEVAVVVVAGLGLDPVVPPGEGSAGCAAQGSEVV
jgi:hypothetical protein